MARQRVISRHRLPRRYRLTLAALWLTVPALLLLTLLLVHGPRAALLDPRLWLLALPMALPAVHVWQEGVDVRRDGIIARRLWPRFYAFALLDTWYYDDHPQRRVITVWRRGGRKVLECRAGHLTNVHRLLDALHHHLRNRRFPR